MSIRRKVRTAVILLTVISMLAICSCGLWGKKDAWEHMEMTQEEKDFLCRLYIDEEKINQGELFPYQVRTVEQYRYAKEVLARKYPSYEFKITYCEPQTIMDEYMELYFREEENGEVGEDIYTMYVYEEKDGYSAKDNFYDKIFSPKYEAFLYENLQEIEQDIVKIKSGMSFAEGDEYDENMSVEDVLTGKVEISPHTSIFIFKEKISDDEGDEIFDKIKDKITKELELNCSCRVMVINDKELLEKAEHKALGEEECLYDKWFCTWEEDE